MISTAAQAAITVLFGAVAGGVTNTVAIWMLFHPYEPPRFFRWKLRGLQGAVPKNRDRLARVVGRTVGDRLLTGDDLAAAVAEPTFRRTFDEQLDRFLAEVLDRERGPLVELLPVEAVPQVRHLLDEAGRTVLDRLDHYLESDDFHDAALAWADRLAQDVRDRPVAELLTAEREQALADTAERWIADAVGGEGFERAVHDYLDRAAKRLLEPQRTFEDLVPAGPELLQARRRSAHHPAGHRVPRHAYAGVGRRCAPVGAAERRRRARRHGPQRQRRHRRFPGTPRS
ncbi:MAG: DUF445 family protein [Gemmatimonadota bacterium]